jgi:transcriptional regulator with XRE-family HTH domain
MDLGKAIKLCRSQRKLTQKELADLANISVSYLSLLEKGKRDPSISTVNTVAQALEIPASILLFLAADRHELSGISSDLAEKLSFTALSLINASTHEKTTISQKTNF